MSFTTRQIVHVFENADGTPASGSCTWTLSKRMTNGGTTIVPASLTSNLDASGHLAQTLTANNDTGTTPVDAMWRLDMRIQGAEQEEFWIVVPSGSGSVDLGTLLPQQPIGG